MKFSRMVCKIVLINSLFYQFSVAKFSFDSIKSYFYKKPHEEVVQKELPMDKRYMLIIKNKGEGNVVINEWGQNSIQLKATKLAPQKELLDNIDINTAFTKKAITITTSYKDEKTKGGVNYELIIPQNTTVKVAVNKGSITVNRINGPISATTQTGNIIVNNTKGVLIAKTDRGNIVVNKIQGNIRAVAQNGNIIIDKSTKSIIAKTKKGAIKTTCKNVRSLDTILLSTQSGNISLGLPTTTNADLQARTNRGKLLSEHYITIKPQTVKLDRHMWARCRREVNGTMGSGEATIKLSATSGNIKIIKAT